MMILQRSVCSTVGAKIFSTGETVTTSFALYQTGSLNPFPMLEINQNHQTREAENETKQKPQLLIFGGYQQRNQSTGQQIGKDN
ncbi:hypothetical protein [Gimesia sp.]|uniref:hypothetical protein n=1 Tax=Gimesia sp. TaxID=2024833 RepID=UPI003A933483